jgi:hypothetical protein
VLDKLESIVTRNQTKSDAATSSSSLFFQIKNIDIRPNSTAGAVPSRILLEVGGQDEAIIEETISTIESLVHSHPTADCTLIRIYNVSFIILWL